MELSSSIHLLMTSVSFSDGLNLIKCLLSTVGYTGKIHFQHVTFLTTNNLNTHHSLHHILLWMRRFHIVRPHQLCVKLTAEVHGLNLLKPYIFKNWLSYGNFNPQYIKYHEQGGLYYCINKLGADWICG